MRFQRMLDDAQGGVPSLALFILYATATGAAIGLVVGYRPQGLALAASGGVLMGLLGWLLFSLRAGVLPPAVVQVGLNGL
jgi:hypothetical protein